MSSIYPIYVVEDDEGVRGLLSDLCEARGLACRTFTNGEDFLKALDALDPGCVLLDVKLPRRNGLQVQAEIVARGCDFPIIVITGYADVDRAVEAMKMGAVDFLEKPFVNDALYEALDRALERLAASGRAGSPQS